MYQILCYLLLRPISAMQCLKGPRKIEFSESLNLTQCLLNCYECLVVEVDSNSDVVVRNKLTVDFILSDKNLLIVVHEIMLRVCAKHQN